MKVENLKKCPFCGEIDSVAIMLDRTAITDKLRASRRVVCDARVNGCGAAGGGSYTNSGAAALWNDRNGVGG